MSDPRMSDPHLRALSFATRDDSEELARAELYGLLSSLWLAPPDAAVLVDAAPQPDARKRSGGHGGGSAGGGTGSSTIKEIPIPGQ